MYKSYSMELGGRTLTVDVGRVAKQANGAALMHYGDTTVLSTATASEKPREGIDFFFRFLSAMVWLYRINQCARYSHVILKHASIKVLGAWC